MDKRECPFVHYIFVLIIGFIISVILYYTLWESHIYAIHTFLEAVCLFIGASTFLIAWNTADKMFKTNYIIGYGFLSVAIYDAYHAYLFVSQSLAHDIFMDLNMKYWILGRFCEAIVLYLVSLNALNLKLNKWLALTIAMIIPFGTAAIIYEFPWVFPAMITVEGSTLAKGAIEFIIILLIFLSIVNLSKHFDHDSPVSFRHFYMALIIAIPTEMMFIAFSSIYSFNIVYGHVLRVFYYYYIYRSVFVAYVEYPYEKMQLEKIKLEEAYRQLEESKHEILRRQDVLMQQEKLALLGQMGAGIVHETKNYLTTIKGSCQLISLLTKEEGTIKHAKKISKNVDEMDQIISKFLFMARPRDTEFTEVSMCDLLQSLEGLILSTSIVKKVDVCFENSKEERYLLCDEGQINQVILNLCKNAVEAMEGMPSAKLTIETGYDDAANEMYVSVIDNGKGISAADLVRIGTPFFTTKSMGTGLGLYVCNHIIKEHKGRLEVSSELGCGTTFTIKLPCLIEEEEDEDEKEYTNNMLEMSCNI